MAVPDLSKGLTRLDELEARMTSLEQAASEAVNGLGDDLDLAGEIMLRVAEVTARVRAAVVILATNPHDPASAGAQAMNALEGTLDQDAEGGDVVQQPEGDPAGDA